jgi:hypothetical protein
MRNNTTVLALCISSKICSKTKQLYGALFTTVKRQKQPMCPFIDGLMKCDI